MNKHKKINKLLVNLALGELSHGQEAEVRAHLSECSECRAELKRHEALLRFATHMGDLLANAWTCESAKQAVLAAVKSEEMKSTCMPHASMGLMRRTVMASPITRLATAAVVIIAAFTALNYFDGSIDYTSVAWADVAKRVAQVDYVHYIIFPVIGPDGCLADYREDYQHGWYHDGRVVEWLHNGCMFYDNGRTRRYFDRSRTQIGRAGPSRIKDETFFSYITQGLLSRDNEQLRQQTPLSVGDDFLIYEFDTPNHAKWQNVLITVGRNSLLPVQMKVNTKEPKGGYGLLIFDYTGSEMPSELFEPASPSRPPHGRAEVVLNGEQMKVDVLQVPGVRTSVIRLYSPPSQGKYAFWADVSFILEGGTQSVVYPRVGLNLNEGTQVTMRPGDWSDGTSRYLSATLVLKPTEKKDIYVIEINCWLDAVGGST